MGILNTKKAFDRVKSEVISAIKETLPIETDKRRLEVLDVYADDSLEENSLGKQKTAKMTGRTWGIPIRAKLKLTDKTTGKVVTKGDIQLVKLPKLTPRFSYIVGGTEWTPKNLLRLKSGVYHRIKQNGELESHFNLAKGRTFHMDFDPKKRKFSVKYGNSNIALYPLLKTMGMDDSAIKSKFGNQIAASNMAVKEETELKKFYKAGTGKEAPSIEDAKKFIIKSFDNTQLRPDTTKATLGTAYTKVTVQALADSAKKLLDISRGVAKPDKRELLEFKEIHSTEDMLKNQILSSKMRIRRRLLRNINHDNLRQAVPTDVYKVPIRSFFSNTSISDMPDQTNPLDMISGYNTTTILSGPNLGGIKSAESVPEEELLINPSTFGFLDPIETPESGSVGIQLNLAMGSRKKGGDLLAEVYNIKTKKLEDVDAKTLHHATVAFPDQVKKGKDGLEPRFDRVKSSMPGGEIRAVPFNKVDYVIPTVTQLFSFGANLVPFLQNNSGNRAMTASRMQSQAVSLSDREAPLVQVGVLKGNATFEDIVGFSTTHNAPIAGRIMKVEKDYISIKDGKGVIHKVDIYNNYPLNDNKSFLSSNSLVKSGDTVEKGQLITDSNFTDNGTLALGKNMKVAYLPYKGLNFEDGIVISDTASRKLRSQHLHKNSMPISSNTYVDLKKFSANYPYKLSTEQRNKLDSNGVIKEGSEVSYGDVMVAATKDRPPSTELDMLKRLHKGFGKAADASLIWEKENPGIVDKVVRKNKSINVYVKTVEPLTVGDKLVGRYGDKGVVTCLIPDNKMPRTSSGEPIEILLNPAGVVSRMNLGQMLETAASKIAKKTGKPYVVKNFDPDMKDFTEKITSDLKKYGLSDTEELFDADSGKSLGKVLLGDKYILKLKHQVTKDKSTRSRGAYDVNMIPKSGGDSGAQSMDFLGINALLASGAKANLREMMTLKSDKNDDMWAAIQAGEPIPTPTKTFATQKFENLLQGLGVDVHKDGNIISIHPTTDAQALSMSNGELTDPGRTIIGKNFRPEKRGLFDPIITGGLGGDKWAHIKLVESFPKPIFEGPIKSLTGLTTKQFNNIVAGREMIEGATGGKALNSLLSKIDVDSEFDKLKSELPLLSKSALSKANKKFKYLRALKETGLKPTEAYMTSVIPVLPPVMRPVTEMATGDINDDDLNKFYRRIGLTNNQLKTFDKGLPEEEKIPLRQRLYEELKGLHGAGTTPTKEEPRGILHLIAGVPQPKKGFFQDKMLAKRQDLSIRATITPEPSMHMDEVGLPRKFARELYKPFIVRELTQRMGYTPLSSRKLVKENHPIADKMLDLVVENRPILMKRDPALHKYSVQAFKPVLFGGSSIRVHPLVVGGFGADFDGDHMSGYVPLTAEAVKEARKLYPSNNLFAPASGKIMYLPQHEAQLGLYKLTKWGKASGKDYKTGAELAKDVAQNNIRMTDIVMLNGKPTTPGRRMLADIIPPSSEIRDKLLSDSKFMLDKGTTRELLADLARTQPKEYGRVASNLLRAGNEYAYSTGSSLSLADLEPEKIFRDAIMSKAESLAGDIGDKELVDLYTKASDIVNKTLKQRYDKGSDNQMYEWVKSGSRGNWDQFRQMTIAPMLVKDARGRIVPTPITSSYAEGLDVASYLTGLHGARKGTVQKVKETREPGALTKRLVNANMNQTIITEDCGTTRGIKLSTSHPDILGRYLAQPVRLKSGSIPGNTEVTPEILGRLKNNGIGSLSVRSALKCLEKDGICRKCMGRRSNGDIPAIGENVGIIASQALGEKLSQGALSSFHTGGVVRGREIIDSFTAVNNLLNPPKTLSGSATLASKRGVIDKITKDPAGGHNIIIAGNRHYIPSDRTILVKQDEKVNRGDKLSSGRINPHELLPLTNLPSVQNYVTDELDKMFSSQGIDRRNMEIIVRGATNATEIQSPGSHNSYIRGDIVPVTRVEAYNDEAIRNKWDQVIHSPIISSIEKIPIQTRDDWLSRLSHTKLKSSLLEAAAQGWKSDIHGTHPGPGLAYGTEFGKADAGRY